MEDKQTLKTAKELAIKMNSIINELEEPKIVQNARKICDTSNKIIETVEKKPNK